MKQLECHSLNCARVDGVWSGPCVLTPQLPVLGEKVMLVMIVTRLGKILLCMMLWLEKYSHMCYRPSSESIISLSSFLATGYKVIDASFIQQMSVLKSLQNLSTFLESSQQPHDDYCELVELVIDNFAAWYFTICVCFMAKNPRTYAQGLQVVVLCEHFGNLTAIQK